MIEIVNDMRKASRRLLMGLHTVMYSTSTLFHKNISIKALMMMIASVMDKL